MNKIATRVVATIGVNATVLNVGILGLCGWYAGTGRDIPNLLLGALIANSGSALGSLSSVLNSTRSPNEPPQPVQVTNDGPGEAVPVEAG